MAENSTVSKVEEGACGKGKWIIANWNASHNVAVAANASCLVEVGSPNVRLRFFLRPKGEIKASLNTSKGGTIVLNKSKEKIVEVIDPFIYFESRTPDNNGQLGVLMSGTNLMPGHNEITDVTINITAKLFRLIEIGNKVDRLDEDAQESVQAEESLIHDMKNMFVEHENYADIKLESKDHMILDAHKFILAARSKYLQKCIDDAVRAENFNGTMQTNVNGKPLVVILHWMYTGELHENCGNVMEEIVEAAILFGLTQLMKILDRKLITICNKENMFRLYQVAQKNVMPNAMDDISAYIRENL